MKIALCQVSIEWESPLANIHNFEKWIDDIHNKNSGVDLMIFPEFFTYGFTMNRHCAEHMNGTTHQWMRKISNKYNCAIIGSVPIIEANGKIYNRMLFVDGDSTTIYDKRHLFSFGGEDKVYTKGESKIIVQKQGWNILLNICYDLRFPVWSRNIDNNYDILINIANWPQSRSSVIEPLVRARAIENQAYHIFVNRIGLDPSNTYSGASMAVDFKGEIISRLGDTESFMIIETDKEKLNNFRDKFRAWADSDNFTIL